MLASSPRWAAAGMLMNVLSGVTTTTEMAFSKTLSQYGWPYWTFAGIACIIGAVLVAVVMLARGQSVPPFHELKWIILRGILGATYWTLSILAVWAGAQPGDVAALTSMNIVSAALLGRLFLDERLHQAHVVAVVSAIIGGTFISKPEFIFGNAGQGSTSWLGYILALTSGFLQSCCYISSRKATQLAVELHIIGPCIISVLICFTLPCTPVVTESLHAFSDAPWQCAAWIAAIFAMSVAAFLFGSVGSMISPAAVSATLYTVSSMLSGYLVQTVLFGARPGLFSLCGAGFMLIAVWLMACAQKVIETELPTATEFPESSEQVRTEPRQGAAAQQEHHEEDQEDGEESLASFAAAEVSSFRPHEQAGIRMRIHKFFRRRAADVEAQTVGVAAPFPIVVA
eukprot:TRINITY_DN7896_c0_g1_i1.p1 TRINITY_DN7896_c0_g1~~TRINITY_DN7896_c0_g1_i1.p1  ORF type:complete len:399 (+),score=57.14 TRINITY_DN7896_c0_g1_i1:71-1267(+)